MMGPWRRSRPSSQRRWCRDARPGVGGGRADITIAQGIDAEFLAQMTNNT
jgi:hypothetical protein